MKVKGKFLGWVNRQGHFAVKCEYDMKAVLMQARSGLYFETPHYEGYDLVLVSLERAKDKDIAEAVKRAWEYVAGQAKGGL
jgi:hypothetical protein